MRSILVATDFSSNAALALKYGLHIANKFNFRIDLVHIYELPAFERYLVEEEVRSLSDDDISELFTAFVEEKGYNQLPETRGVPINFILRQGNITKEVSALVKELDPIMVISGAHGSGAVNWEDLWLGGTVQKFVRKLPVPVMIVPPDIGFRPIGNIGFATDFNPADFEVIPNLITFARNLNATVTAIHVQQDPTGLDEVALNYMRSKFTSQIEDGILRFELILDTDISEGLNRYINIDNISLLAVLREKQGFLPRLFGHSDSMRIAFSAGIPTVVLKEK
ncbi:MAG: universal stress protein [Bacteroidetes bacterium]|nr:universal stress protein [Bacteroidota bacterium]